MNKKNFAHGAGMAKKKIRGDARARTRKKNREMASLFSIAVDLGIFGGVHAHTTAQTKEKKTFFFFLFFFRFGE